MHTDVASGGRLTGKDRTASPATRPKPRVYGRVPVSGTGPGVRDPDSRRAATGLNHPRHKTGGSLW